jgi:hypothetical protein
MILHLSLLPPFGGLLEPRWEGTAAHISWRRILPGRLKRAFGSHYDPNGRFEVAF